MSPAFMRCFFLLLVSLLASAGPLRADRPSLEFLQANRLYAEGNYAEAITRYQGIIQSGRVSPALYFNLGNAFFKSGRLGLAIANYRLAQELAPRDADLRANLQFTRSRVKSGGAAGASRWRSGLAELTVNEWTIVTVVLGWLWLGLLAAGQWQPGFAKLLTTITTAVGILLVVIGLCLAARLYDYFAHTPAVVIAPEAAVRYGPFNESREFFKLTDGAEVFALDHQNGWVQVQDAMHRTGWLRSEQVDMLRGNVNAGSARVVKAQ